MARLEMTRSDAFLTHERGPRGMWWSAFWETLVAGSMPPELLAVLRHRTLTTIAQTCPGRLRTVQGYLNRLGQCSVLPVCKYAIRHHFIDNGLRQAGIVVFVFNSPYDRPGFTSPPTMHIQIP